MNDQAKQFRNRAYFGITAGILAVLMIQAIEQLLSFQMSRDGFALLALVATAIGSSWAAEPPAPIHIPLGKIDMRRMEMWS